MAKITKNKRDAKRFLNTVVADGEITLSTSGHGREFGLTIWDAKGEYLFTVRFSSEEAANLVTTFAKWSREAASQHGGGDA